MTQNITIPAWVRWLAQDADGAWWGYEQEPLLHDIGWYENEIGRRIKLDHGPANHLWHETLHKIS